MRKSAWNTYRTTGYTYDVANDQRSAGGVHHHQVRKTANGWQRRIEQTNGRYSTRGPVTAITDAEGEAAFAAARQQ